MKLKRDQISMHRLFGILGIVALLAACSSDDEERAASSVTGSNSAKGQSQVVAPVQEPEPKAQAVEQVQEEQMAEPEAEVITISAESDIQKELKQASQMLESARNENDELAARIQKLEAIFKEQEQNMQRQDEKLNDLKQQLENQTQE
jgi:hypothetical protein